ncbi:hypothetical protein BX600DRAFT_469359 [Xylariales sp. PMI_506]|nr:hypothetical protein BX600DRAFT_469359 [Xylariales sp. PMI_506]
MYWSRLIFWISVPVALLGLYIATQHAKEAPTYPPPVPGRKNTVLFLSNCEAGLSNTLVATAAALLERHPDVEVHFASFPTLGKKISRVSSYGLNQSAQPGSSRSDEIIFHPLTSAPSLKFASQDMDSDWSDFIHPPGLSGLKTQIWDLKSWMEPWGAEHHLALYREIRQLIDDEIDPALVVLDTFFRPAVDAARGSNRLHSLVSPNQLIDNFIAMQPRGTMMWKFPVIGSGYPFPVPLHLIPANMYQLLRILFSVLYIPKAIEKRQVLMENGIPSPVTFDSTYRSDAPWITQGVEGASIMPDYIPDNVTVTGPLVLSSASAEEQDAELVDWLKHGKQTMLINLGSTTMYDKNRTVVMAKSLLAVLDAQPDLQILWKYQPAKSLAVWDDLVEPLSPYVHGGKVKITTWIEADPLALLETGLIDISVHHGGANCYWEAVAAGVPQVVLPFWSDHYSYARLVDQSGLGVYGCQENNPYWTVECLSEALLSLARDDTASQTIRRTAQKLGDKQAGREPGRYTAARKVAQLAAYGK